MAKPDIPIEATQELKRGNLTTVDAVAMAIAVLSPAMAMAYNTTFGASFAGTSNPLAFLLGGIACLTLAWVVIGFTRRMASAGYAYTYVSRSIGPSFGFLSGWLYFFGFLCFVPMTMAGVGGYTSQLLKSETGLNLHWFIIFLIGMALLVLLAVYDVKIGTRTQLVLAAVTVAVIVVFDLIVTGKGGLHGHTLAPFTFSHTLHGGFQGVFYGIIFAVTSYIGFETSAVLGEETRNPRRAIPLSIMISVVFAILFYVWTTYNIAIGVGVNNGAKWANDGTILADLGTQYGGHAMFVLISIAAVLSAFMVSLACANAATRTMFAMGREGALPRWFGRTNAKYQTPANATLFVALLATAMAALVGFKFDYGAGPFTVYGLYASIGSIPIILVYMAMCAGSVPWFKKVEPRYNPILHGLVPIVGFLIFGLAVYASVWSGSVPPPPYNVVPYVALVWLIIGVGALLYLRSNFPQRIDQIGSILGEEGGEEAGILDVRPSLVPGS